MLEDHLVLSAESQLLLADPEQAVALFTEAAAVSAELGNVAILSHAELAALAMDRGEWVEAADHLKIALTTIDQNRLNDYSLNVPAYVAAARLAVHRSDRNEAGTYIARAMRARPTCTFVIPWLAVRLRVQLAKMYAAIADPTAARHLLAEIDEILIHRPALGALAEDVTSLATP